MSTYLSPLLYENGILGGTISSNVPQDDSSNIIGARGTGRDVEVDWVFVRKYTSPEPSTSVGSEETSTSTASAITGILVQSTLDTTEQFIANTGIEPERGRGLPVDHLYKASVSLTMARAKLLLGDAENAFIRLGKAIRELKYACDSDNPTGDIIRELVETPTILECTSDGQYASTGINRTLLETAYDDVAAFIDSPDPLWQEGAVEALNQAAHNLEVAVYKMDLGKVDEAFVYLGWAIGYLEDAGSLGAPTDTIIQALVEAP